MSMVKMPEVDFLGFPMMHVCSSMRVKTECKGIVECDILHRYLNSWSPHGSHVWGGFGSVVLLEEVLGGCGFKASNALIPCLFSLFPTVCFKI